jgi:predicted AlkP superfamily phosphohydrolase/phosphomutase
MGRAALLGLLLALAACGPSSASEDAVSKAVAKTRSERPERFRRKVIVLGFDSCDPDLVDEYVKAGKLPHFARLYAEGAHGPLGSIAPLLSPVVWTTMATGMPPQRHGILDFVTQLPDKKLVPVSSRMRQADTVWELLSSRGEEVGVVGWLVTWPAEKVNGFLVTERMSGLAYDYLFGTGDADEKRTWPDSLAAEMKEEVVAADGVTFPKIRQFVEISEKEYAAAATNEFNPSNRVGNLRKILATGETYRNIGERLYAEERPRFFACYFEAMDAISHLFMPYAPPKQPHVKTNEYLKYRDAMEANYAWHDRVLGEYMDLVKDDPDVTLFVVSDHGFKSGEFRTADSSDFHAQTGAMWHRKYGVFYAWGNGVKRGATVAGATVYDLAPTILAAMGYPAPDDMPGKVLEDAFEGGLPHETVETYRGEARRDEMAEIKAAKASEDGQRARSPEEEDAIRKLEALGYIGGDRSDPVSTSLNLGYSLLDQGRPMRALEEFKKVLEKARATAAGPFQEGPDGQANEWAAKMQLVRVLDAVAVASLRTGGLDEAEQASDESLSIDGDGIQALNTRVQIYVARGKLDDAEKSARAATRLKPDVFQTWVALAWVLETKAVAADKKADARGALKLRVEAVDAYERALRLEPRQVQVLNDLAAARLSASVEPEQMAKARRELERVLEMAPRHVSALNSLAIAKLRLGMQAREADRVTEADESLRDALRLTEKAIALAAEIYGPEYRGYAKGWANKAYVLWQMGRLGDAEAAAKKVRLIEPSYELNGAFVRSMTVAGRAVPPPEPKKPLQGDVR